MNVSPIRPSKGDPREIARALLRRWERDPGRFASDLFGLRLSARQGDMVSAVVEHPRVAIRSGHKVGKSLVCAVLALWWVSTQPGARVILLAPSYRQINEIVWREVVRLYHRARWPLGGRVAVKPEEGMRWAGGRQIFGFSTDSKERVAGYSGNILYVLDEASGIDDDVHEVVSTNPRGRVVMISNPTRSEGGFYRAFHGGQGVWRCVHVSSEEAARENREVTYSDGTTGPLIPGVADQQWVDARKAEFGEDSYFYDVRVRGVFSRLADNAVIPLGLVDAARSRWTPAVPVDQRGRRLEIGVDVARFGEDDSCIVWRRGSWASSPVVVHGMDNVTLAGMVGEIVMAQRTPGERPVVRVDTSNGGGVADILRRRGDCDVLDVLAQDSSNGIEFARRRDEMWFALRDWLEKRSGALAPDDRLAGDLVAPTYDFDERGRRKVESKRELKARIKRSTDRADALALAVFDGSDPPVYGPPMIVSLSSR